MQEINEYPQNSSDTATDASSALESSFEDLVALSSVQPADQTDNSDEKVRFSSDHVDNPLSSNDGYSKGSAQVRINLNKI